MEEQRFSVSNPESMKLTTRLGNWVTQAAQECAQKKAQKGVLMRKVSMMMRKITAIALSMAMLFGLNPGALVMAAETISTSASVLLSDTGAPRIYGTVSATFSYVDGASVSVEDTSYGVTVHGSADGYTVYSTGTWETGRPDEWKYVHAGFFYQAPGGSPVNKTATVGCSIYGELY